MKDWEKGHSGVRGDGWSSGGANADACAAAGNMSGVCLVEKEGEGWDVGCKGRIGR